MSSTVKIASIISLTCLDAIFTVIWIEIGIAYEANPIMDFLIEKSYKSFFLVKMLITTLSLYVISKYKNKNITNTIYNCILLLYTIIIAYHSVGFLSS